MRREYYYSLNFIFLFNHTFNSIIESYSAKIIYGVDLSEKDKLKKSGNPFVLTNNEI